MTIKGAVADVAARLLSRLLGLRVPSSWSVRVLREANHAIFQVRDGQLIYRFVATTPTLLWRARTLLSKEPETIAWLRSFDGGDVLYDIGANVGVYSIVAAAHGARVFAFEPEASNFAVLNQNIAANACGDRVRAYPLALADVQRLDTLRLSRIEAGAALHAFGSSVDFQGEAFEPAFEQGAMAVRVDDLVAQFGLPQPTRIKIDVDGIESAVVAGARKTLENPALREVLIEINENNLADLALLDSLAELGLKQIVAGKPECAGSARMRNVILSRQGA